MINAAYGSVSDIEVVWVIIALVGLFYSGWNLWAAKGDLEWILDNSISNGRKTLAWTAVLNESIRFIIQFIFVLIGVLAFALPEAPNSLDLPWYQVAIGIAIRWGLITSSVLLTVKSFLGKRARDIIRGH